MLDAQNISTAMPIQEQAIPHALCGRDLVAIAQTGTGKTLAFGLPSLTRIAEDRSKGTKILVLCPTRELAEQIHQVLNLHAKSLNLNTCCICGGVSISVQSKRLRKQPSIIVATPGRLLDHIGRGNLNFEKLQILTLDEADRMLDMGFLPDITRIVSYLPQKRQTLLFSATFPKTIQNKVKGFINNPVRIEIASQDMNGSNVTQGVYPVSSWQKPDLLEELLKLPEVVSTIVFTKTRIRADQVCKKLRTSGFRAESIHGNCTQIQRMAAINNFKSGNSSILVATDIAARGIDVKGVTHVINYDIPNDSDNYVHRIGRTARAMAKGIAYTFVSPGEEGSMRSIEKVIGKKLSICKWAGMVKLTTPKTGSSGFSKAKSKRFKRGAHNAEILASKSRRVKRNSGENSGPESSGTKAFARDPRISNSKPPRNRNKQRHSNAVARQVP